MMWSALQKSRTPSSRRLPARRREDSPRGADAHETPVAALPWAHRPRSQRRAGDPVIVRWEVLRRHAR